jgi:hypothetical protein
MSSRVKEALTAAVLKVSSGTHDFTISKIGILNHLMKFLLKA